MCIAGREHARIAAGEHACTTNRRTNRSRKISRQPRAVGIATSKHGWSGTNRRTSRSCKISRHPSACLSIVGCAVCVLRSQARGRLLSGLGAACLLSELGAARLVIAIVIFMTGMTHLTLLAF
jgi:hypothetical protein